jgi:transposase
MVDAPDGADPDHERFVARVRQMYEQDGLSTRRIAEELGVRRKQVDRALRTAGVVVAPRGAGRRRPTRHPDPENLEERLRKLYSDEGLTRRQASEKLGLSEGLIRTRLAEFDIPTRTRGRCNREDRIEVAVAQVLRLYRDGGLTAQRAADLLGVSRVVFLRAAHDHGVPVRPGAVTQRDADSIKLISALYADPLVRGRLERHGVPIVNEGGPIWQRFPRPVPLTTELCVELYVDCGLSTTQIELVTGQPASRARSVLRKAGVQLRSPGGRSPFRIRWEQGHPPT